MKEDGKRELSCLLVPKDAPVYGPGDEEKNDVAVLQHGRAFF